MWKMSMWNALKANWNFINSKIIAFDWCITMLVRRGRVERSTVWSAVFSSQPICWKLEIFSLANAKLLKLQQLENIWIKIYRACRAFAAGNLSAVCDIQMWRFRLCWPAQSEFVLRLRSLCTNWAQTLQNKAQRYLQKNQAKQINMLPVDQDVRRWLI